MLSLPGAVHIPTAGLLLTPFTLPMRTIRNVRTFSKTATEPEEIVMHYAARMLRMLNMTQRG